MSIGDDIKRYRIAAGMTQEQLADKIGVSRVTVTRYEGNKITPSFDVLEEIEKALNVKFGITSIGLEMHEAAVETEKAMSLHKKYGYKIGEVAKMLNEAYPNDGNDYSFADFSYFDAMKACFNSLCLDCGYLFEIIEAPKNSDTHATSGIVYHIFNDNDDFLISYSEITALWHRFMSHMTIDFKELLQAQKK